jgi:hypothetical protein
MKPGGSDRSGEIVQTARWQSRLLPFMMWAVAIGGVVFFAATLWQLHQLQSAVEFRGVSVADAFRRFEEASKSGATDDLSYLQFKTLALLEETAVSHRYHAAGSVLLARVWTRYAGFLTGMILSLVGATFILGKLREEQTQLGAEGQALKLALYTSSPGIVLATLGTLIMITTLAVPFEVKTQDAALYVRAGAGGVEIDGAAPPRWPEANPPSGANGGVRAEEQRLFDARKHGAPDGKEAKP